MTIKSNFGWCCAALYMGCSLVRIKQFESRKDFIVGSAVLNASVASGILGLAHLITKLPNDTSGSPATVGDFVSIKPLAVALLAFGTLNSLVGGMMAHHAEKTRRATPLAIRSNGTIGPDYSGNGRIINPELVGPESAERTYWKSCKSIINSNILSAILIPAVPAGIYRLIHGPVDS